MPLETQVSTKETLSIEELALTHYQKLTALKEKRRKYERARIALFPKADKTKHSSLLRRIAEAFFYFAENLTRKASLVEAHERTLLYSLGFGVIVIVSLAVGLGLLAATTSIIIGIATVTNLGIAIYDYVHTPKNLRTPLQKFNAISSAASTLLTLGLIAAVILASVAIPGALFAAAAIGATLIGFKYWQGYKGHKLKEEEDIAIDAAIYRETAVLQALQKEAKIQDKLLLKKVELKVLNEKIAEKALTASDDFEDSCERSHLEIDKSFIIPEIQFLTDLVSLNDQTEQLFNETNKTRDAQSPTLTRYSGTFFDSEEDESKTSLLENSMATNQRT